MPKLAEVVHTREHCSQLRGSEGFLEEKRFGPLKFRTNFIENSKTIYKIRLMILSISYNP